MKKLILYISCSLDGYIAAPGDDLSFLNRVGKEGEDYGYTNFVSTIDTVIMGRKTYDWILAQGVEFPHKDKESYIVTRTPQPTEGSVHFYDGELKNLVEDLKSREGKNIFCDGGAFVVNELLKDRLFDELIISIIPVLLGSGTRLFDKDYVSQDLQLLENKSFETGLVQLKYSILSS